MAAARICALLLVTVNSLIWSAHCSRYQIINVGIVSGEGGDSRENDMKFWRFNRTLNVLLEPVAADVNRWDSLDVTRAVCSLLKLGVHVLVSSPPHRSLPLLKAYSEKFQLPLVTASSPMPLDQDNNVVSLRPSSVHAVADLLVEYQWQSFIFIYDNDNGPGQLEKILEFSGNKMIVDAFWRVSSAGEVRLLLDRVNSPRNVVTKVLLSTKQHILEELTYAVPVGLFHFVFVDPVVEVENSERRYVPSTYLITEFSIPVNPATSAYQHLENRWQTILAHLNRGSRTKTVPSSALYMNDIANVLEKAFRNLLADYPTYNLSSAAADCFEDRRQVFRDYSNLVTSNIRKVALGSGMTGDIRFSSDGRRTGFGLDVKEITSSGVTKVGTWSSGTRLKMTKPEEPRTDKIIAEPRKKVIVTSILSHMFLRLKPGVNGTGNDRFEGYVKDLLDELAQALDFDYVLRLAKDGTIGEPGNDGRWTGMVGEVLEQEADLAIGPMETNPQRAEVVDFSKTFLNVGLTLLLKKPEELQYSFSGIGPFGMLRVWSYDTWLILVLCYLVFGGATYLVSRFTGDPDRIRSLETKLSDRLSPCSSFWFVFGILTFRGTGIYPKSFTFRLLALVWGFFSLMLFLYYVSCLSSLLQKVRGTSDTAVYSVKTMEFLKNFIDKGYPKVGVWRNESFFEFAEKGLHKSYGDAIENDKSLIMNSYDEGVEKIRNSNGGFAMLVDSAYGHFISERPPCDTMITSGYLMQIPYAIAFKKGSELRVPIDRELLGLMGRGELRRLYEKWWHYDFSCVDPFTGVLPMIYSNTLTLHEVSGVFYFLIISICIAVAAAVAERFLRSKKLPVEN